MNIIDRNIIGNSSPILIMKEIINRIKKYPATVLITGETGTGKELVARSLHYSGCNSSKPFIAINCSTFNDDLFSSELFGYKKGAFTDAKTDKEGLLSSVGNGTIFLDEVDSLSPKSQATLLRVLQEGEFRPIGSNTIYKTNVRFIAATNTDLETKIINNEFRQDLYFRLFVLSVDVPALRDRKEDIPALVEYFIDNLNSQYGLHREGISNELMTEFLNYDWPGNIRELENTVHRYYLLSRGAILTSPTSAEKKAPASSLTTPQSPNANLNFAADIVLESEFSFDDNDTVLNFSNAKRKAIELFEAKFVSRVLYKANGNVTKAAKMCGKERRAFGKLVKKYNIKNHEINVY